MKYTLPIDDNTVEISIPLPGRKEPIDLVAPLKKWADPKHVAKYLDWLESWTEKEREYEQYILDHSTWTAAHTEWLAADTETRGDEPVEPVEPFPVDDIPSSRDLKVKWLENYLTPTQFIAVNEKLSVGAADWIDDRLEGKPIDDPDADPEISAGESGASALS